jgi:small acid-soluble spore protein H (minor)
LFDYIRGGYPVNSQRAQEIAASPVMANVTFQDTPVYIQHVDQEKGTARIFPLQDRENEQEVPVNNLVEH